MPKAANDNEVKYLISLPASLDRALRMEAATDGTSKREIILRALKDAGFDIDEDVIRDRRRPTERSAA